MTNLSKYLVDKINIEKHTRNKEVCTSNHMFGMAMWDKFPKCIFEKFEIACVKQAQFENFQKS